MKKSRNQQKRLFAVPKQRGKRRRAREREAGWGWEG